MSDLIAVEAPVVTSRLKTILEMSTTGSDAELVVCSGDEVVHSSSVAWLKTHPVWKNGLREAFEEVTRRVCLGEVPRMLTRSLRCCVIRNSESAGLLHSQ